MISRPRNSRATYWYRNDAITDYGHRTAAELVAEGQVEALAYIRDLENAARVKVTPAPTRPYIAT
ncbi:hypothetical protein [Neomesorhizobium albiziae]|uniref:hypothetical protein n=1 Tax=Neomesorhizobium albiziae TaxID=335020 RepID=UPI003CC80EC9